MLSGFTFNRIVIIQSLDPSDPKTGEMISDFISGELNNAGIPLPVEIVRCGYAGEFIRIIERLTVEAALGRTPLLHVECHGHKEEGLVFENSSTLSWENVANSLLPLNVASGFNLLAVFSACFGAYFLGQMGVISTAPCWCLVAPTKRVDPGEIYGGFYAFYSALIKSNDMGYAVDAIAKRKLTQGRWLSEFAEVRFESVIKGYVERYCNNKEARERARRIYRQLKGGGKYRSIGALLRILKDRNREKILGEYFNSYFAIDKIPENSKRFGNTKLRVSTELTRLRKTNRYVV